MLLQDGSFVHVYVPKVTKEDALTKFKYHNMHVDENRLISTMTPEEAIDGAHALVILIVWGVLKTYPYHKFFAQMLKPAFLFDGR